MDWSFQQVHTEQYDRPIMRATPMVGGVYWEYDVIPDKDVTQIAAVRRGGETTMGATAGVSTEKGRRELVESLERSIIKLAEHICYHGGADTVVGPSGGTLAELRSDRDVLIGAEQIVVENVPHVSEGE